jgi:diaminopimelate decarboxylase
MAMGAEHATVAPTRVLETPPPLVYAPRTMSVAEVSSAAAEDGGVGGCVRGPDGALRLGTVRLSDLADATHGFGTPTYVYDLDAMVAEAAEIRAAFAGAAHLVAYALKANSAGAVVRALGDAGCGADVVSGAELALALGCGIAPESIVFNGVAKTDAEIDLALASGSSGIAAIQAESVEEIDRVAARARLQGRRARIGLRVNPGLDKELLGTHDHVATGHDEAKFGISRSDLPSAFARCQALVAEVQLAGIANHVGSQLTQVEPYRRAAVELFALAAELRRGDRPVAPELAFVDCGGGFGVDYGQGPGARPAAFVRAAREAQRASGLDDLALYVEPGRSLVATHGVLLATVIQEKRSGARRWVFVDAGMNDLVRPAMYGAHHRIVPLEDGTTASPRVSTRIAGPVCESSDDFGVHTFPEIAPAQVALLDAGAYGFTMASRYNGRALPAEVFLSAGTVLSARRREDGDAWTRDRLL